MYVEEEEEEEEGIRQIEIVCLYTVSERETILNKRKRKRERDV